jgi:hypothetical protein
MGFLVAPGWDDWTSLELFFAGMRLMQTLELLTYQEFISLSARHSHVD